MAAGKVKHTARLTLGGAMYLAVLLIVLFSGLNSQANLLFLLFGIGLGGFFLGALLGRAVQDVHVERTVPEQAVRGRSFPVVYTLTNQRWWSRIWSVRLEAAPGDETAFRVSDVYLAELGAGQTVTIRTHGLCDRRGRHACGPIRLTTRYPFGFLVRTVLFPSEQRIVVYPTLGRLRRELWANKFAGGDSAMHRSQDHHAVADEFYGLREYRQGDNQRWIHWRRSARTGVLMVRQMAPVRPTRLVVVLDARGGASRPGADPACEEAINFAATLIQSSLDRGHQVGLIANAATPVVVPPGRGGPHRRRLLAELAVLEPHNGRALEEAMAHVPWAWGGQARYALIGSRDDANHGAIAARLLRFSDAVAVVHVGTEAFRSMFESPSVHPSVAAVA